MSSKAKEMGEGDLDLDLGLEREGVQEVGLGEGEVGLEEKEE